MNGLTVSWFFPPATSAEGLVTFKLLKNSSFRYDVVSAESRLWSYSSDTALSAPNIRCLPAPADSFRVWVKAAAAQFAARDSDMRYGFLMTRAMPPESHQAGLAILKKRRLPWIASMADPIGRNPYDIDRCFSGGAGAFLKNPPRFAARAAIYARNLRFDRCVQEAADLLIFPSETQCRYTLGKNADRLAEKCLILPHSYDRALIRLAGEPEPAKPDGRITLAHLGHLNRQRSAVGLIEGAALLRDSAPGLAERLRIRLVGNLPAEQAALIEARGVSGIFSVEAPVDYFASVRIMKQADTLLLIDALFPFLPHNIFFASKLADYMGAAKPVVGLTTREGPSGEILTRAGCPVCAPDDAAGICALLRELCENGAPSFNPAVYAEFDAEAVAKRFDERVQALVAGH